MTIRWDEIINGRVRGGVSMSFYLPIAAKNKGWTIEYLKEDSPYLVQFEKNGLSFYSTKYVSIDVNHQSPLLADHKGLAATVLAKEGIRVIPLSTIHKDNQTEWEALYQTYSVNGTKPVVLKPIASFGGKGVIKCDNYESFCAAMFTVYQEQYCISTFFDHVFELRMLVFLNKVELICPKYDNPLNPLRPALPTAYPFPLSRFKAMQQEALKVAKVLHYDFIAIDFLVAEDEFRVLEVNLNPNLLPYNDQSKKHQQKAVKLYEKILDYKELLLKKEK